MIWLAKHGAEKRIVGEQVVPLAHRSRAITVEIRVLFLN